MVHEEDGDSGSREEADQGQEQEGVWVCQWVRWRRQRLFMGGMGSSRSTRHLATYIPLDNSARGQPWLSLDDKLVIRDFSTARVLGSREARGAGAAADHHILSGSPAYLRYNNNAGKNEGGGATVLVLAPAQTRIHGHGRSQAERQTRLI
jgi:hypothetical protein